MASRVSRCTLDVHDVEVMTAFWSKALGYRIGKDRNHPEGNESCVLRGQPR